MSRQFQFFLLSTDLARLSRTLLAEPGLVALAEQRESAQPEHLAALTELESMGARPGFLVRSSDLPGIAMTGPTRGRWYVDSLLSPVIEVRRSILQAEVLRSGRMYLVTRFYGEGGEL